MAVCKCRFCVARVAHGEMAGLAREPRTVWNAKVTD